MEKCVDGGNCGCGGYCEKCVLSQPLNFKDVEVNEFYLQDSRSYVGNDLLFWAKNGKGYTTDLRLAEVYSRDVVERMHQARETDIPWPKDYIDKKTRPAVDMQYVKRDEALAGTGIVLIAPKKYRKPSYKCNGCGVFMSEANYWSGHCKCGADSRP